MVSIEVFSIVVVVVVVVVGFSVDAPTFPCQETAHGTAEPAASVVAAAASFAFAHSIVAVQRHPCMVQPKDPHLDQRC